MKKSIIVLILTILGFASNAQVTYGLKFGVNISSLRGDSTEGTSSVAGIHAGGLVNIPVNEKFSVQPELMFSMAGAKDSYQGIPISLNLSYISLPVLLQYKAKSGVFAELGPQISFLLSAKAKALGESQDVKEVIKSTDFSAALGVGYKHVSGFGVNLRYNLGLINIAQDDRANIKTSIVAISVFYTFGKMDKKKLFHT